MMLMYTYKVAWSTEDSAYIAEVAEFPLLKAHGDTPTTALQEIKVVVAEAVEDLRELGEPIPQPQSLGAQHD